MYKVYILQSLKNNRYYTGHTDDVVSRLKKHNNGLVKSTKPFGPWKVVYCRELSNKIPSIQKRAGDKKLQRRH